MQVAPMTSMVGSLLWLVCLLVREACCDYSCLCSYQVELEIFEKPDPSSNVDGYMYEFDCKPSYHVDGLDPAYEAVGNEGKLGYVQMTTNIQIQTCQGSVPDIDRVKTTSTLSTTTKTTSTNTMQPSTTTMPTTTRLISTSTNRQSTFMPPTTRMMSTSTIRPATTTLPPTPRTTTTQTTTTVTVKFSSTPRPLTSTVVTTSRLTPLPTSITRLTRTTFPTTTKVTSNSCPVAVRQKANPQHIFQHGSICYEFVPLRNNWKHAQNDCNSKGGHLVSIENEDQQKFVSNMLVAIHFTDQVWLGLHDRVNEEQWMLDIGVPANFTNWFPGRFIDQYHDQEDCGLMLPVRKHQWDDVDCDGNSHEGLRSYAWICQYT